MVTPPIPFNIFPLDHWPDFYLITLPPNRATLLPTHSHIVHSTLNILHRIVSSFEYLQPTTFLTFEYIGLTVSFSFLLLIQFLNNTWNFYNSSFNKFLFRKNQNAWEVSFYCKNLVWVHKKVFLMRGFVFSIYSVCAIVWASDWMYIERIHFCIFIGTRVSLFNKRKCCIEDLGPQPGTWYFIYCTFISLFQSGHTYCNIYGKCYQCVFVFGIKSCCYTDQIISKRDNSYYSFVHFSFNGVTSSISASDLCRSFYTVFIITYTIMYILQGLCIRSALDQCLWESSTWIKGFVP